MSLDEEASGLGLPVRKEEEVLKEELKLVWLEGYVQALRTVENLWYEFSDQPEIFGSDLGERLFKTEQRLITWTLRNCPRLPMSNE